MKKIGFILLSLLACSQEEIPENIKYPFFYPSPTANYKRDSLFIATTVWQFIDKEVDIFQSYKRRHVPLEKVRIHVDSIFYSPDSLKLFAFVITENPDLEEKDSSAIYYSGSGMIAYRDSLKQPWIVHFFGQYRPAGWKYYNQVRNLFRHYYLKNGKFKNDSDIYWDGRRNDTLEMVREITFPKQNNRVSIKFDYNLDEPLFWSKSIVWKKGNRIPGYYSFETNGNVAPGSSDPIKNIPKLYYPDSLLNLYK